MMFEIIITIFTIFIIEIKLIYIFKYILILGI